MFSVKFWGTRGSVATPGPTTLRCGGNTACVEVRAGKRLIILDAGTGIRELGLKLEEEDATRIDILVSHGHMDHLMGFPFFNPAYHAGTQINMYLTRAASERRSQADGAAALPGAVRSARSGYRVPRDEWPLPARRGARARPIRSITPAARLPLNWNMAAKRSFT